MPERLGRLRRIDRIGAGGFATVWLYHDDELDSPVAVKALADNWAIRDDVCDRFLEEARILRRADSDHVVRVYDIGEADGTPYFVMSYADRGSVGDLVAPGQSLPPGRVVDLLAQACEGVAVLHHHGVIHRDIKPQNLLLRSTPDGGERVMVADLGVAKAMLHASGLTQVVGTPAYMAPEQAIGIGLDQRADVHALGAVGYHLLTGRLVRNGGIGSLGSPSLPPAPSQVAPVPSSYDAVLLRALATEPDGRWPDVVSFVAALRDAERSAGVAAPVTVQAPPPPSVPPPAAAPSSSPPNTPPVPLSSPTGSPEPGDRGALLRIVALVLLVLLVAFGASYGVTKLLSDSDSGKDPSGQDGSSESPTGGPAADIDYPALAAPQDYDPHEVRSGAQAWSYPVPTGWAGYRVADETAIPPAQVDDQGQVRWRPGDEPVEGGYSLRVKVLSTTDSVADVVAAKVAAVETLKLVDVYEQTDDTIYFTYRDGNNRLRYNFFRWVAGESGRASLEISVAGRKVDEDGLSALLDRVSGGAKPA